MTRLTLNSDMLPFIDIEIVERVIDGVINFPLKSEFKLFN